MANNDGIVSIGDQGEVEFNADMGRSMITVSVRPPLGIQKASAEIALVDFLEFAAKLTLESCKMNRAMMAAVANKRKA